MFGTERIACLYSSLTFASMERIPTVERGTKLNEERAAKFPKIKASGLSEPATLKRSLKAATLAQLEEGCRLHGKGTEGE
jgi:hypothetical protein